MVYEIVRIDIQGIDMSAALTFAYAFLKVSFAISLPSVFHICISQIITLAERNALNTMVLLQNFRQILQTVIPNQPEIHCDQIR
jgi:hypothetical protein